MRAPNIWIIAAIPLAVAGAGILGHVGLPWAIPLLGTDAISSVAATGTNRWIAFAALQIVVSMSGVLPASALGVAAGSIYGTALGFVLSAANSLTGAAFAFGLSRSVFRAWIERRMHHRTQLQRIDAAIRRDGWRLACLIRLSPIMPFAATSYLLGLSSIRFRDYCIGTLGSMPALFGYVVIGDLASAGVQEASTARASAIRIGLLVAGLLATGIATLRIGRIVTAAMGYRPPEMEANPP